LKIRKGRSKKYENHNSICQAVCEPNQNRNELLVSKKALPKSRTLKFANPPISLGMDVISLSPVHHWARNSKDVRIIVRAKQIVNQLNQPQKTIVLCNMCLTQFKNHQICQLPYFTRDGCDLIKAC